MLWENSTWDATVTRISGLLIFLQRRRWMFKCELTTQMCGWKWNPTCPSSWRKTIRSRETDMCFLSERLTSVFGLIAFLWFISLIKRIGWSAALERWSVTNNECSDFSEQLQKCVCRFTQRWLYQVKVVLTLSAQSKEETKPMQVSYRWDMWPPEERSGWLDVSVCWISGCVCSTGRWTDERRKWIKEQRNDKHLNTSMRLLEEDST